MVNISLTYVFNCVNEHMNDKNNINIIKLRINVWKKSFAVSAFMLWNKLPYDIRTVSSY